MSADFERASRYRPSAYPCPKCGASPEEQRLVRGPTGYGWRCSRCNHQTSASLPFDPRRVPQGRAEMLLAIEALAVYVPILRPIDPDLVYPIVRPYFGAGWCVRDILHAINYLPDGDTHPGQGAAWVRGEPRDRTLWRMRQRLRAWRFSDRDDGEDIMFGPYTATSTAMRQLSSAQARRTAKRSMEWRQRVEAARQAEGSGARELARRQAAIAASLARQARSRAEQKERDSRRREAERARTAAANLMAGKGGIDHPAAD